MKLSRIPGQEPTVKSSFSFKKSTHDQLSLYLTMYQAETGAEIVLKDMVERMLLDFMADDKAFQRELRARNEAADKKRQAAPAAEVSQAAAPAELEAI